MIKIPVIPFTKEGYEKIKKEHEALTEKRKGAVTQLQRAREMGDLSENGFYKAAKANLSSIDHTLHRLKYLIRFGHVREVSKGQTIDISTKVLATDGISQREFEIVGGHESDPSHGKISHFSPIGKALIGKRAGEEVIIQTPSGKKTYNIIKIY